MLPSDEDTSLQKNQLGFDPDVIRAFTRGDCWRLSLDLHNKLGYPVHVVTDLEIVLNDNPSAFFHHMVVENPVTGKFIDVDGEHTEAQLLSQYGETSDNTVIHEVTSDLSRSLDSIAAFAEFDASLLADEIINRLDLIENTSTPDSDLILI